MKRLLAVLGYAWATAMSPSLGAEPPERARLETAQYQGLREDLLPDAIERALDAQLILNIAGGVVVLGTGALAAVGATRWNDDPSFARPTTVALGSLSLAGGTSLVLGQGPRDLVLPLMPPLALGTLSLIGTLHGTQLFRPSYYGIGYTAAGFGTAALLAVNLVSQYGTMSRLRPHHERMQEEVSSPARMRDAEQLFLDGAPPLPCWLVVTPLAAGSALALVASLDRRLDRSARYLHGLLGGGGLSLALLHALSLDPIEQYRSTMEVMVVGTGVSVVGTF